MSVRLGIWVGTTELRAVAVRGERVIWRSRAQFAAADGLNAAFEQLFTNAPTGRFSRPRAGVAIGFAHSQVRQIERLPRAKQLSMLTRIVGENAGSFFLRLGSRLVVTQVERRANGDVWAAAFDGALVDDVLSSLRRRGFRRVTVVPSIVAYSGAVAPGAHTFVEEGLGCEAATDPRGNITRVRRVLDATATQKLPPLLAGVGDDASDFVGAYRAAFASPKSAFIWRAMPSGASRRTAARIRVAVAAAALVTSVLSALFTPGVRATLAMRSMARDLDGMRGMEIELARTDGELRRVNTQLDRIEAFRAARGRVALLVGALSQSIPESTALVSLRIDTLDASFVALATHAADILPQLDSVSGIVAPRIVGSIGREMVGGARVERATIRFRRQTASARRVGSATAGRQ